VSTSFLIIICFASLLCLLWLLRRDRASLGLPIAYLYSLLLIHVPGAFAHVAGGDFLFNSDLVNVAMRYTALGTIVFVLGCWWGRTPGSHTITTKRNVDRPRFWWYCVIGGWVLVFGLTPLYDIPSFNALGDRGSTIWMLGVLLGLRDAFQRGDRKWIVIWICALLFFPAAFLVVTGFLSYGSAAVIVVCSALAVSTRSYWRVVISIVVFTYVSLSIYVNYFEHREEIRKEVWSNASRREKVDTVVNSFSDFQFFDPSNPQHLIDLDKRLNENYFVGLAARRIENGQVSYLKGESLWEGLIALVPRIFWPEKPVYGGSPQIVSKMTGLRFSSQTSIGVGNVMELQINFGMPGVAVGFFVLGWAIGKLDLKAAIAERRGQLDSAIMYFLPCVAMIQPNGSIVEITGGAAAAFVAAYLWSWLWIHRVGQRPLAERRPSHPVVVARSIRGSI
jgi:hypothetical protein